MTIHHRDISACVFDAYGTLFDLDSVTAAMDARLGGRAGELGALWRRKQLEHTWLRSLMGRYTDFWHVTGESLDVAMQSLGLTNPLLRAELMQHYLSPTAYPGAADAVDRLAAAGLKTAILSNGSPTMLTGALSAARLENKFDAVISVEEVSVYKPHPSVYKLACDRFDLQPGQIAFVSSNSWDAAGAAAFGFRVVWINRTGAPSEKLPGEPEVEIAALADLPALLGL
jgi:2-haloacid dehalogenase